MLLLQLAPSLRTLHIPRGPVNASARKGGREAWGGGVGVEQGGRWGGQHQKAQTAREIGFKPFRMQNSVACSPPHENVSTTYRDALKIQKTWMRPGVHEKNCGIALIEFQLINAQAAYFSSKVQPLEV